MYTRSMWLQHHGEGERASLSCAPASLGANCYAIVTAEVRISGWNTGDGHRTIPHGFVHTLARYDRRPTAAAHSHWALIRLSPTRHICLTRVNLSTYRIPTPQARALATTCAATGIN
jgi:hypothetical protein